MPWVQLGRAAIEALPAPRNVQTIDNINHNAAVAQLAVGPLGVGEDHTDGRARTEVINLINAGLVQRLFLECDDIHQQELDNAVAGGNVATIAGVVTNRAPQYGNPVPLGNVATAAMGGANPIPMHFVDTQVSNRGTRRNLILRDANAAANFRARTQVGGVVGCLVLFGAHHFRGEQLMYGTQRRCLGQNLGLEYVDFGPM